MLTITEPAYDKIADLLLKVNDEDIVALRVAVQGGGCSGFQYAFQWATSIEDDDIIIESDEGLKVVVDAISMMYLEGAELDYEQTLAGEHFKVKNPNTSSTCGCGSSFSV